MITETVKIKYKYDCNNPFQGGYVSDNLAHFFTVYHSIRAMYCILTLRYVPKVTLSAEYPTFSVICSLQSVWT